MKNMSNSLTLSELTLLELNCSATEEQSVQLKEMLEQDPDAIDYYVEFMMLYSGLSQPGEITLLEDNNKEDAMPDFDALLLALAEDEKSADTVEVEKPTVKPLKLELMKVEKPKHTMSRFSIYTLALSAAAVLLLMVMLLVSPVSPVVAYLADSIDAEWISDEEIPVEGEVLRRGTFTLVKGYASIVFGKGTEVVIESPATFEVMSDEQMKLSSGRISAKVPGRAIGFIVQTPTASIIDYGTEFGVLVDEKANTTEAHVFRGEVDLRDGSDPARFNVSKRLKVGMAAAVTSGRISNVYKTEPERFVKELPSKYEMAIRRSNPKAYWRFAESLTNLLGNEKFTGRVEGEISYENLMTGSGQRLNVVSFNPDELKGNLNFGDILNPDRGSFTVSMWFKPLSLIGKERQFIATKRTTRKGWSIISIGDDITLRTGTGVDENVWIGKKDSLTTDWHHIVMVIDRQSNKLKGYLDGSGQGWNIMTQDEYWRATVEVTTDTYTAGARINNDKDLTISHASDDFEGTDLAKKIAPEELVSPFHGLVYDFAVWKRALNENEIRNLYYHCPLSDQR